MSSPEKTLEKRETNREGDTASRCGITNCLVVRKGKREERKPRGRRSRRTGMPSQKQTAQHAKMLMLEIPSERTNKISARKARRRENTPRRATVGSHANESTVVHSKESVNPMMKHKEHWKRRNNKVKKQT